MKPAKIRLPLLLLVVASAGLIVAAAGMLFSAFMFYDDEGYVLISLRSFIEHGHLYGSVYSQYGPFPYVLYYFLHLLGLPITHMAGRTVTLVAWSGCATLSAWMTWRATRSSVAMLGVVSAAFAYLWIMISEPSHPGGLIALMTAILAALGCKWLATGNWPRWAVLAGAGSAVLLLTKINVGAFAVLSAVAMLLLHSRDGRVRRWAPWVLGVGVAALPWLLMRPLLDVGWIQTYAIVFALSGISAIGAAARTAGPECGIRPWLRAVAGGVAIGVVVVGVVFARGTTPAELLQGVVLGPMRHPQHFSLEFRWPLFARAWAMISLGIFLLLRWRAGRGGNFPTDSILASLRLLAASGLALMIWRFPGTSPDNVVFGYAAPCLWFFLWPLASESTAMARAQTWLGLLFLGQWLHVYPVPGSQIAWGTFLAIPLVTIGAWNAARLLAARSQGGLLRTRALSLALQAGVLALAVITGIRLGEIGKRYLPSRPLKVPGAEMLRLPDSTTALFRLLVFNAEAHGDMVFSLPGMFSLNFWTGLPTPTTANVTHWFSLLDDAQQQAIIRSLEAHPRACIVLQKEHLRFLRGHGLTPGGPLYDYIMTQFDPVFEVDGFEFRVHHGRRIAPLLTAELFQQRPPAAGATADAFDTLLKVNLLLPPEQQIGSIEITRTDDPFDTPLILQGDKVRIEVTPIDLAGDAYQQPQTRALPFAIRGPATLAVFFNRGGRGFSMQRTLVIVRNTAGAELALVRLRP